MSKKTKKPELRTIRILVNDRPATVSRNAYVAAKTKQLREFGYTTLTEGEVDKQIEVLMSGEKPNVIGMFMQEDFPAVQ